MTLELRLILAAFAVYRLAQLIAIDDGPLDLFRRLRAWAITGWLGGLLHCPFCLQIWLALPLTLVATWPTAGGDLLLTFGGLAGAACWLQGSRDAGE